MDIRELELNQLIPPRNLRSEGIDSEKLGELTESIREIGLLQPIRVRPVSSNLYQIIAGHRRFLAHKALGRQNIAAVVVEETDQDAAVQSIVENLQREDLTPLELAKGILELSSGFQLHIDEIAKMVSKSSDRIRTWMRIANLPDDVLIRLESGEGRAQRVTSLTPRHMEPFVRRLPSQEEAQQDKKAATLREEILSDVREFSNEYERMSEQGTHITAHMADAIARETRHGSLTVPEAVSKILSAPENYRYTRPLPTQEEFEANTFGEYRRIHSDLLALAHKLRPEIAVSFSDDKKRVLLERLLNLDGLLSAYRDVLMAGQDITAEEQLMLPVTSGSSLTQ